MTSPAAEPAPQAGYAALFNGTADLGKIEELVLCCKRRRDRAAEKLASAQAESADAQAAYDRALAARDDWIANGPDAQLLML